MRRCQHSDESFTILRKARTTWVSTDSPQSSAAKWNDHSWHTWRCRPSFHWTESDITVKPLLTTIFKFKVSSCGENHLCVKSGNCQLNASLGTRESALSNPSPHKRLLKISSGDKQLENDTSEGHIQCLAGMKMWWNRFMAVFLCAAGLWRREDSFIRRCAQIYSFVFRTGHLHFVPSLSPSNNNHKLTQTDQQAKENAGRKREQLIRYESFHEKQHFSYLFDVIIRHWLSKSKTSFPVFQDRLGN